MIYYFLPGAGIFGGIKMGYQLVDSLNELGRSAVIAVPGGEAAQWFTFKSEVVDSDEILESWNSRDIAIFSLPHDYKRLRAKCERLIFHCQGTDPAIDSFIEDRDLAKIACWIQAREYFEDFGIEPAVIPLGLADIFFYAGETKERDSLAYMPRRGLEFFQEVTEDLSNWSLKAIDGLSEHEVARILRSSSHFLASSRGEWFGLPALEAMAAGCLVLSPETLGGAEYLLHNQTAIVGEAGDLKKYLSSARYSDSDEAAMTQRAMAMAHNYSMARHRAAVAAAIDSGLFGSSNV